MSPSTEATAVAALGSRLGATSVAYRVPDAVVKCRKLWHLDLGAFEPWRGETSWDLCFGKGGACIVDPDDSSITACVEVVIARRLSTSGGEAWWLNTYSQPGPSHWTPTLSGPDAKRRLEPVSARLAARIGAAGTPDVLSTAPELLFIEVKRERKDRLSAAQVAWITAALREGLDASKMIVATWSVAE